MFYKAKEFTLKNGLKVTLKSPEVVDATKLLNAIIETARHTDFILSTPEDFQPLVDDITKEEAFIKSALDNPNGMMIAVYVNDNIVGNCALNFYGHIKDRHRGTIGIGITPKYQGMGIGSLLFDEMINIAKNRNGVTQLELGVMKDNIPAKRLYTSKGFIKTGETPRAMRLPDGTYLDEEMMVLYLDK